MAQDASDASTRQGDYDSWKALGVNVLVHAVSAGPQSLYALAAPGLKSHFLVSTEAFGFMFSLQSGTVALTSLCVGIFALRINLRLICTIAMLVHIVGNFAAFFIDNWSLFLASRVIVSVADGLLLSCSNAALAGSRNHTRNWSFAIVGIGAFAVVGSVGLPWVIEGHGVLWFYAILALAGLVILPLLRWLPQRTAGAEAAMADPHRRLFPRIETSGLILLALVTSFAAGMYALTPYVAIIGEQHGWSLQQVGAIKSVAFMVAMAVPFIPIFFGHLIGLGRPLLFVACVMTASAFMLGFYPLGFAFAAAIIGLEGVVRLGGVYLNSVLAKINPAGNLNAAMTAFSGLGGVLGPIIGALLLGATGSFRGPAVFAMFALMLGLGAYSLYGFRLDRKLKADRPG